MTTPRGDHVGPRQVVRLEGEQHDLFTANAAARGHSRVYLLYGWLKEAVIDARLGRPLPKARREPRVRGQARRWEKARWLQADDEFADWSTELEAAGSSVTAVLRYRVDRYNAANGNLIEADLDARTRIPA